jgi:hypothetical protein
MKVTNKVTTLVSRDQPSKHMAMKIVSVEYTGSGMDIFADNPIDGRTIFVRTSKCHETASLQEVLIDAAT